MKTLIATSLITLSLFAQPRTATEKPGPQKSGFYSFLNPDGEFSPGIGNVTKVSCVTGVASQPATYALNLLLDCDGEVPHNETTLVVNPNDRNHAIGAYHSYQLTQTGGSAKTHVVATTSVTFDGGQNWQLIVPPIQPYKFTGDPALAFGSNGRVYFANIADQEGPGNSFTGPSVVVTHSDDGGMTWSDLVTVARGQGAVNNGNDSKVFQDKEFIAVDTSTTSPYRNRAYISWTSFQEKVHGSKVFFRSPIMLVSSSDGERWTAGREISGFHPACSVQLSGAPNECDLNQHSYPAVAPGGRTYVSFENFNTPAENQMMVVTSTNGGGSWSNPVRVDQIADINLPANADGRATLTGCQFRVSSAANIAADPSDPTGRTAYVTWADNRNGSSLATNLNIYVARTADGGATWSVKTVDNTANDQFYPWVAVAGNGRVDIGYMDRSYSAGQGECQYGFTLTRMTFDAAGNVTTSLRQRVDSGLSDVGHSRWFSGTTNGNGRFIGDYNAVAVGPDGVTWSLWTDQRNLVANPPSATRNHGQHAVGAKTP